ncbi:MAG: ATP-binding cassette domain-containing protein [Ruminococcaceae bacterium]|nr:ATP-binding cassette domain-containing protein [Oscillospiraceae bacterium]
MIEIKNLSKSFQGSDGEVNALKNVTLTINDGDIYGIIGMSGAGKSTLVRCINMLERPTDGKVVINGTDIGALSKGELLRVRRKVTMIFQGFNLLMQRTCLKNICFPLELAGVDKKSARKRALELLDIVGLPDKANAYPAQLSGGQQQRIAIARALATDPEILLCDEATSALDPNTTHSILSLIREINKRLGITVIVITHQMSVVEEICNRVAILDGGVVVEEGPVAEVFSKPKSAAAKKLVFPDGADEIIVDTDEKKLRVVFNGAYATRTPMITQMAVDISITANILAASTRCIGDKVYGNMLLGVPDEESAKKAIEYLTKTEAVFVEEVCDNV